MELWNWSGTVVADTAYRAGHVTRLVGFICRGRVALLMFA